MAQAGWTLGARPADIVAGLGILAARDAALLAAGIKLQSKWVEVLNTPGGGVTYTTEFRTINGRVVPIGRRSSAHTASAPGQPPAPDTGESKQSIAVVPVGQQVRVGTGKRSLLALEYGVNVSGSKVGPHPDANFVLQARPHARPAFRRARRGMNKRIKTVLSAGRIPAVTPRAL